MDRWRGRRLAGPALAAILVASVGGATVAARGAPDWIVVRDDAGAELARVALPTSGAFGLRYRNSVYGSIAEEWFRVQGDALILERLAADELAVLEEYYTATTGATRAGPGGERRWVAPVERPSIELPLRVRATTLGERTLLGGGVEVALWRLVATRDDTLVVLSIEGSR
jgi:hypothetical protein